MVGKLENELYCTKYLINYDSKLWNSWWNLSFITFVFKILLLNLVRLSGWRILYKNCSSKNLF